MSRSAFPPRALLASCVREMLPRPTILLPALVVFDLDFTLWHRPRLRGGSPFTPVDDGFGGIKSSCGQLLDLYPASRRALLALSDANVPVAIASRTHRAAWARQWLEMLRVEPGGRTTAEVIGSNPIVIQDGPKSLHLKEIQRRTGVPLGSMLFFDDNLADVRAAARDGVTSVHCIAADRRRQRCGLTDAAFQQGLREYAQLAQAAAAAAESEPCGAALRKSRAKGGPSRGPHHRVFAPRMTCGGGEGGEGGEGDAPRSQEWDSAWRRRQQEGLSGDESAIVADIPPGVQEAKAALWQAELNVLSARTTQAAAREDVARAKAELEELAGARERFKLPYDFEEINEIQRLINNPGSVAQALSVAAASLALVLLVRAGAQGGAEGVAGCALKSVVCIMNAVI